MRRILGLDIGGANLKAASLDRIARTHAFPLWKHPDRLSAELQKLCAVMPAFDELAITMTAELCDCFATKRDGVQAILQSVSSAFGSKPVYLWSLQQRFFAWDEAYAQPLAVAAANWLALAHWVAQQYPAERVLLLDAGSSTTDILYLQHGIPEPRGYTDLERMQSGELVYTGVRRTPVCAVLGMEVAAEWFATMQDAYVLTRRLPEDASNHDTADGRPMTRAHAHARLARMRCADVESFAEAQALVLAERALQAQWQTVACAVASVLQGRAPVQRIVLSGSGEVLGQAVCSQMPEFDPLPKTLLSEVLGPSLSEAACAYAVAALAAGEAAHA